MQVRGGAANSRDANRIAIVQLSVIMGAVAHRDRCDRIDLCASCDRDAPDESNGMPADALGDARESQYVTRCQLKEELLCVAFHIQAHFVSKRSHGSSQCQCRRRDGSTAVISSAGSNGGDWPAAEIARLTHATIYR